MSEVVSWKRFCPVCNEQWTQDVMDDEATSDLGCITGECDGIPITVSEDLLVPPLPPGCSLERKDRCGSIAWTCGYISMLEHIPLERKLIACYMRCAWKDEAERLGRSGQPWQQSVAALAAAEAWKIWGQA